MKGARGGETARKTPAQRRRARERRFRSRVESLQGCFGVLSDSQRQVIELRAGLGGQDPRSVGQVAQELGVSRGEVASTQRQALRRLGRANRRTGCGGSVAGGGAPVDGGGTGARVALQQLASAAMPRLQPAVLLTETGLVPASDLSSDSGLGSGSGSGDHGDVRGTEASSDSSGSGLGAASGSGGTPRITRAVSAAAATNGGPEPSPLVLSLMAALGLATLAALAVRRREGGVVAAGIPAAGAPAPASDRVTAATATAPPDPLTAAAFGATAADQTRERPAPEAPEVSPESAPATRKAPPGDTAAAAASSLDSAAAAPSPGDPAAAPGPPGASAPADAVAGRHPPRDDTTVVRRRTGGLVGAVKPAAETARDAASSAQRKLLDVARRARERRNS